MLSGAVVRMRRVNINSINIGKGLSKKKKILGRVGGLWSIERTTWVKKTPSDGDFNEELTFFYE